MCKLFNPVLPCMAVEVTSITHSGNIDNAFVPVVLLDKSHKEDGFAYVKTTTNVQLSDWVTDYKSLPLEIVRFDGKKDQITLKFNVKKGNPKANDDKGDITVKANGVTVQPEKFSGKKYDSTLELKISMKDIKKNAKIEFVADDDDIIFNGGINDVTCGCILVKGVQAPEGFYYMGDGTLVGRVGKDNAPSDVYQFNKDLIDFNKAQKLIQEINAGDEKGHELVKVSSAVGMKNEELNTRAFFTLIRQAENGNKPDREPLAYNVNFGGETFSSYDKHPNKSVTKWGNTSTAAGAYQILYKSWKNVINKIDPQPNFSPKSQDRGAVILINEQIKWNSGKKDLIQEIESGNVEKMCTNLNSTWTSLPGGKQEHMNMSDAKIIFKENISKELKSESIIETPKGELTLKL